MSLRKGSDDVDDEDFLKGFFLAVDFLGVEAVGAFFFKEDWEAVVAEG